jgi:hypothetical protein
MGEQLRKDTLAVFNGAMDTGLVLSELKDVTISVLFKKGEKINAIITEGLVS